MFKFHSILFLYFIVLVIHSNESHGSSKKGVFKHFGRCLDRLTHNGDSSHFPSSTQTWLSARENSIAVMDPGTFRKLEGILSLYENKFLNLLARFQNNRINTEAFYDQVLALNFKNLEEIAALKDSIASHRNNLATALLSEPNQRGFSSSAYIKVQLEAIHTLSNILNYYLPENGFRALNESIITAFLDHNSGIKMSSLSEEQKNDFINNLSSFRTTLYNALYALAQEGVIATELSLKGFGSLGTLKINEQMQKLDILRQEGESLIITETRVLRNPLSLRKTPNDIVSMVIQGCQNRKNEVSRLLVNKRLSVEVELVCPYGFDAETFEELPKMGIKPIGPIREYR